MREIRDPIYGFIEPTEEELKIIDSPLLQRLRRIRQLAMAYLVYPGANHTRFDHSLGVLHVAGLMAEKLLPEKKHGESIQIVRFAALLHDVGHGPFSHVSEDVLKRYVSGVPHSEKIHERITQALIESDKEIRRILGEDRTNQVVSLLSGRKNGYAYSIMKEIISGPLDADKIDYLLRDSHFCGVKYGIFDLNRLLNILVPLPDGEDIHLGIETGGIHTIEQFLLAKYYMTRQVYRHKIRLLSDSMIVRALELGIEVDNLPFLKKLFCHDEKKQDFNHYLSFWDDRLLARIMDQSGKGLCYELFKRLYERKLFKRIYSRKIKEIPHSLLGEKLLDLSKDRDLQHRLEREIAGIPEISCPKEYVIVNGFKFKSVKEMSRDNDEGKLLVLGHNGHHIEFQQESLVFNSIDETLNEPYFEVYAPCSYTNRMEKNDKLKKIAEAIERIFKKV